MLVSTMLRLMLITESHLKCLSAEISPWLTTSLVPRSHQSEFSRFPVAKDCCRIESCDVTEDLSSESCDLKRRLGRDRRTGEPFMVTTSKPRVPFTSPYNEFCRKVPSPSPSPSPSRSPSPSPSASASASAQPQPHPHPKPDPKPDPKPITLTLTLALPLL